MIGHLGVESLVVIQNGRAVREFDVKANVGSVKRSLRRTAPSPFQLGRVGGEECPGHGPEEVDVPVLPVKQGNLEPENIYGLEELHWMKLRLRYFVSLSQKPAD